MAFFRLNCVFCSLDCAKHWLFDWVKHIKTATKWLSTVEVVLSHLRGTIKKECSTMKMAVIIKEFLYEKQLANHTKKTLSGYKYCLELFAKWLDTYQDIQELEDITPRDLKAYIHYHQKQGHKATYINGIIKVLRSFFKYCNGEEYCNVNYKKLEWARQDKPVINCFTPEQAKKMVAFYNGKDFTSIRNKTMIILFIETGVRCNELICIRPEDIKGNFIVIRGKNHKERMVAITPILGKQLIKYASARESYFDIRKKHDDTLFLSFSGRTLTNAAIEQIVKKAGADFKNTRVSPHTFRHFFAQQQLKNGMDIYSLSRLLGHESVAITQVYLRNMRDMEIVEKSIRQSVLENL